MKKLIINNQGTINLSKEAITELRSLDLPLAEKLINLNGKIVEGYLDLFRENDVSEDFSFYDIIGNNTGCTLPFYIELDNEIVLLNLDYLKSCTYTL